MIISPSYSFIHSFASRSQRLKHPNIIKLLRILRLADRIAMVMEYASGGEVFDHVQSKGHLPETEVRIVMKQLISGIH